MADKDSSAKFEQSIDKQRKSLLKLQSELFGSSDKYIEDMKRPINIPGVPIIRKI